MEAKDIKGLTTEEIQERLVGETHLLEKMKFSHAISPIENPMKIRHSRHFIARLKTELRAREIADNQ